jgi:hypothetical protein
MDEKKVSELLEKSAHVDRDLFERTQEVLRKLRQAGVKSGSISALPATDPYSTTRRTSSRGQIERPATRK